jgi:hypothetical protein
MPSAQDPFYVVKEEIQESVSFFFFLVGNYLWSVAALSKENFYCEQIEVRHT